MVYPFVSVEGSKPCLCIVIWNHTEKELVSLRAAWAESPYPVSEEVWMTKHFMNAGDVGQ
jgi:hypothetical protein